MGARIRINSLTRSFARMKAAVKGPSVVDMTPYLTKTHNWTIFYGSIVLGLGFYSSVYVTMARRDTF